MAKGSESSVKLTDESSIPDVIRHMTLTEKSSLCCGKLAFENHAVERLGIPKLVMADGHNGINIFHLFGNYVPHAIERLGLDSSAARELVVKLHQAGRPAIEALRDGVYKGSLLEKLAARQENLLDALSEELKRELPEAGLPTCFPTGIVAGAAWDPELAAEYGRAEARESLAYGMDIMLGPNVNIHRDPLCGRVFESYSRILTWPGVSARATSRACRRKAWPPWSSTTRPITRSTSGSVASRRSRSVPCRRSTFRPSSPPSRRATAGW